MTTGRINQGAARGPRAPPEESGGAAGGPRGALGHGRGRTATDLRAPPGPGRRDDRRAGARTAAAIRERITRLVQNDRGRCQALPTNKRRYATHPPTAGVVLSEPHRFFATSRDAVRNRTAERSHATGKAAAAIPAAAAPQSTTSQRARCSTPPPVHPRASPAFGNPLQPARGARPAAETASREATPRSPAHTRIARAGVRPLHSPGSKCHGTSPHRAEAVGGAAPADSALRHARQPLRTRRRGERTPRRAAPTPAHGGPAPGPQHRRRRPT
jgi:hypothetical protein